MPGRYRRTNHIPETADVAIRGLPHEIQRLVGERRNRIDHALDGTRLVYVRGVAASQYISIAKPA